MKVTTIQTDYYSRLVAASLLKKVKLAVIGALFLSCISCTGLGIKAEMYRIDERKESISATHKPLKCLFIPCDDAQGGK
jgi:hypothetical protein